MKNFWLFVALGCLALGCRRSATDPGGLPVAGWHFVGGTALATQKTAPVLAEALSHPKAAPVLPRLATNLAVALLGRTAAPADPAAVASLVPLAEDLLRGESAGEIRTESWQLAVRAGAARLPLWQAALPVLARMLPAPAGATPRPGPALLVTNGWLLAAHAADGLGRARALTTNAPAAPLTLRADLSRILGDAARRWPAVEYQAVLTNGAVRAAGRMRFDDPPLAALEPWRLPAEQIREPLVQFAAARGIKPWLERIPWLRAAAGSETPNQVSWWSQGQNVPFRTWFAAPVNDANAVIQRTHDQLVPWFDGSKGSNGPVIGRVGLVQDGKRSAVAILDLLKVVHPVMGRYREGEQQYLLGSFFAPVPSTNPVPRELVAQLQRPNVVYYDFEITAETVTHWTGFRQFGNIVMGRLPSPRTAVAQDWLLAALGNAGECVTEVTQSGPAELAYLRKSPVGLASYELAALAFWLDGPAPVAGSGRGLPGAPRPGTSAPPAPGTSLPPAPAPAGRTR
ncbi:MAG: hypothetical protein ACKO3N_17295 [Verrucomicrobiota bacterium]